MTKTILIAEDNVFNMKLIRDTLEFQGYKVVEAQNGKIALNKIIELKSSIDLILMDVQMPEMDGLEVIRRIKADDSTKNIPVIVISAHAMENDIKKARDAGCIEYITKPINLIDFIKKINSLFET